MGEGPTCFDTRLGLYCVTVKTRVLVYIGLGRRLGDLFFISLFFGYKLGDLCCIGIFFHYFFLQSFFLIVDSNQLVMFVLVSLTRLIETMYNICKVWDSKPDHHKKKSISNVSKLHRVDK